MDTQKETKNNSNVKKAPSKKRKRSKLTIYDEKSGVLVGERQLRKIGNGYYLHVPHEFMEAHGLKGDEMLPFIAKYTLKYIPIKKNKEWGDI